MCLYTNQLTIAQKEVSHTYSLVEHTLICVTLCFTDVFRCQEMLLTSMKLGENIARNAALRENVFMMAICIELRIPLFLIGKPGSSKSLAKAIISDSMRGKDSRNDLLKGFKEVCTRASVLSICIKPLYYNCGLLSGMHVFLRCFLYYVGTKIETKY